MKIYLNTRMILLSNEIRTTIAASFVPPKLSRVWARSLKYLFQFNIHLTKKPITQKLIIPIQKRNFLHCKIQKTYLRCRAEIL